MKSKKDIENKKEMKKIKSKVGKPLKKEVTQNQGKESNKPE
jgi:hypothetical protein